MRITDRVIANERLRYLSSHDALTELFHRAYFDEIMARLRQQDCFPVTVLMADVDNLKSENDLNGHEAGDMLLKLIAQTLKNSLRKDDLVARMGGDEFTAILVQTDNGHADLIKRRIEENLQGILAPYKGSRIGLSVGSVTIDNPGALSQAVKIADQKMYIEKAVRKRRESSM